MRKGIFSKLAVQNIRNNKSTYIPYMITCIFCIAMIYMMEFLRDCPTLDQAVRHAAEVRMILSTGEVVVVIFCVIFLIYSNSFLMKRRQKEIGLYNILGLERNHVWTGFHVRLHHSSQPLWLPVDILPEGILHLR